MSDLQKREGNLKNRNCRNRMIFAAVCALMLAVAAAGCCGKNGQTDGMGTQSAASEEADGTGASNTADGDDGGNGEPQKEAGSEATAMGRYVETAIDLSEYVTKDFGVTQLADGSLLVLDEKAGQIVSTDGGETWETKPIPGIDDMDAFTEDNYIFQIRAGLDGTVYVLSSPNTNGTGEFHVGLLVGRPDGSSQVIKELPTDGKLVSDIWVSPENRLFVRVSGASCLYELHLEDGSLSNYITLEYQPDLVQFQGDYMILMTAYEGVTFYDMKEEKIVADDVLKKFMEENYLGEYYADESFTVYVVPGEEEVVYIAGKGGVYRHVIGGSAMEQIIDGSLSSFSNPAMNLRGMTTLPQDEFLVLFSGGQLIRYTYDPNVPTVPEDLVTVYALEDWDAVRQAIAQYQTEHPDTFVKYEVALDGADGQSREDAIKKLNTELMAGKGPDVIILDELPIKSYMEKGILMDLKPHIDGLTGDGTLLPNIVESFTENGSVYMMPVSFALPMMGGRKADVEGVTDYTSLADTMERLRKENPDAGICDFFSGESTVRQFLPVGATAFADASGKIDEALLREYLSDTQRIYMAANEGLPDYLIEQYANQKTYYQKSASERSYYYHHLGAVGQSTYDFLMGDGMFTAGMLYDTYDYQRVMSVYHVDGFSDEVFQFFDGMSEGVFVPSILVGLNASSAHQKEAEQFFDVIMGTQVQSLLFDGFMTNQKALEEQLSPQWKVMQNGGMDVDYGEVSSSVSGSSGDGREYSMNIYMPTKEEYQALYDRCQKVHTPYVADSVVEDAVISIGGQYLDGTLSLDEAVQKIMAKVEIYSAE